MLTDAQLRDPNFRSYEKSLAIGEKPLECECGECRGPAVVMPALTNDAPHTGTLICPRCWHPLIGRMLWTLASMGGAAYLGAKKWRPVTAVLTPLGLIRKLRGHNYEITPAGMAVLWVKERVGWEFEHAHARGEYRSERLGGSWSCGYWSDEPNHILNFPGQQWIHHRWAPAGKVWPIKGVGVFRFGEAA